MKKQLEEQSIGILDKNNLSYQQAKEQELIPELEKVKRGYTRTYSTEEWFSIMDKCPFKEKLAIFSWLEDWYCNPKKKEQLKTK